MPRHRSVYVNSVVNSNMDSTVHVNNAIFPFIHTPFKDFDCREFKSYVHFAVGSLVHCEMTIIPLKYIKYLIKIKHT